jgi:hypothetical protein
MTQKTHAHNADVQAFIEAFTDNTQKRLDSSTLIALMEKVSHQKATLWGPSIIGFGKYRYTYASGHSGEAPILGFSPRKAAISLYVFTGLEAHEPLLEGLGKYTKGKACIYVKKFSDINLTVLEQLMHHTIAYLKETYEVLEA